MALGLTGATVGRLAGAAACAGHSYNAHGGHAAGSRWAATSHQDHHRRWTAGSMP